VTGFAAIPRVRIEAGGAPIPDAMAVGISEIRVRRLLSAPTQCEILITDPRDPDDVADKFTLGDAMRIRVNGHSAPLFAGEVSAVERTYRADHGVEIRVRGYDLLHRLRMQQSLRAHVQVTARDVAAELVTPLGLSVEAMEDGPAWPHLVQHGQSDLELLLQLTEAIGTFLVVDDDVLRMVTLEGDGDEIELVLGDTLLEASIEVNGASAHRAVTTLGWDPLRLEPHTAAAGEARSGRRVRAEGAPDSFGVSGDLGLPDEPVPNDDHARALAQAQLDLDVAGEVTLWGIARGDPGLRPGARVEVSNVAPSVSGRYVLTQVTHTVDRSTGFLSEISTLPPVMQARTKPVAMTVGTVSGIDDPERLGRIQVELPTFGGVLTPWLGVVSIGAGAGKGLVALPDIGDQVVVAMPHEDPTHGIVVGSLYGSDGPPDAGVEGGRVRRFSWLSPGGQRILLDDESGTLRVENAAGSFVELAPDGVTLHSETDLTVDAPGKKITIRGAAVEFETG
jgi:phage baseplate assembly protein gpV/phage protein D